MFFLSKTRKSRSIMRWWDEFALTFLFYLYFLLWTRTRLYSYVDSSFCSHRLQTFSCRCCDVSLRTTHDAMPGCFLFLLPFCSVCLFMHVSQHICSKRSHTTVVFCVVHATFEQFTVGRLSWSILKVTHPHFCPLAVRERVNQRFHLVSLHPSSRIPFFLVWDTISFLAHNIHFLSLCSMFSISLLSSHSIASHTVSSISSF